MGLISAISFRPTHKFAFLLAGALAFGSSAGAQVVLSGPPTVGSSQPVSPEPAVIRPTTTPCKVTLFTNAAFNDFDARTATYTPPSACPGPWAKVVFTADFTVSAGRQYDRSSEFFIGNATLFRGTTAEPRAALSPSWHVESDATDLSALLSTSQPVVAHIDNVVNSTYTGIIYANAELDFYPADTETNLAPTVPDQVIPLVADTTNPYQFFTTSSPLTVSVTLPKNATELYLDVIAQPDEFWWLSTPNAQVAPYIQGVDATALRELDVTIDGKPAGIAPNHPYVFTGGIDPYLWQPIPASQTLHLKPYRINLTPFAGLLSDGNAHTFVVNDINTIGSASVSADLFVYTDHGGATTTGAVSTNTLTVNPGTAVTARVDLDSNGNGNASVSESLDRNFTITGYVNSSAGKVTTTVAETVKFTNSQQLTNLQTPLQNVVLDNLISTVDSTVTTVGPKTSTTATYHTENPLQAFISFNQNTDGTYTQTTTATVDDVDNQLGPGTFSSNDSESVTSTDSLAFNSSQAVTGHSGAASTGTYQSSDSLGNQYSSTLTSVDNVLTGAMINASSTGVDPVRQCQCDHGRPGFHGHADGDCHPIQQHSATDRTDHLLRKWWCFVHPWAVERDNQCPGQLPSRWGKRHHRDLRRRRELHSGSIDEPAYGHGYTSGGLLHRWTGITHVDQRNDRWLRHRLGTCDLRLQLYRNGCAYLLRGSVKLNLRDQSCVGCAGSQHRKRGVEPDCFGCHYN